MFLIVNIVGCETSEENSFIVADLNDQLNDKEIAIKRSSFHATAEECYSFGFDLRASPQEDARQYLPFLRYLEQATSYCFKLRFTPRNSTIIDELGQNRVQFAALGAVSFLIAEARYQAIPLVRGVNAENQANYRSIFIVAPKSPLQTLQDIKGKRLALGNQSSTQGHLVPRIELQQHGVTLNDLAFYLFTGSHQRCASEVIAGRVDACGLQDTMAERLAEQGLVRILYQSDYYPSSGIAANNTLPDSVIERVKQALLEFDPMGRNALGLHHWERTEMPHGFVAAWHSDYDVLRPWLKRFGLIGQVNP